MWRTVGQTEQKILVASPRVNAQVFLSLNSSPFPHPLGRLASLLFRWCFVLTDGVIWNVYLKRVVTYDTIACLCVGRALRVVHPHSRVERK